MLPSFGDPVLILLIFLLLTCCFQQLWQAVQLLVVRALWVEVHQVLVVLQELVKPGVLVLLPRSLCSGPRPFCSQPRAPDWPIQALGGSGHYPCLSGHGPFWLPEGLGIKAEAGISCTRSSAQSPLRCLRPVPAGRSCTPGPASCPGQMLKKGVGVKMAVLAVLPLRTS